MADDMEELRAALKAKMDDAYRVAQQYEKAYKALTPGEDSGRRKYFGLRIWQAVREYLRTVGGEAAMDAIEYELVSARCELGKYPRRTLKNAVCSPHMLNRVFRLEQRGDDELVSLLENRKERVPLPVAKVSRRRSAS
jgi:hypothetical protein